MKLNNDKTYSSMSACFISIKELGFLTVYEIPVTGGIIVKVVSEAGAVESHEGTQAPLLKPALLACKISPLYINSFSFMIFLPSQ